MIEARTANTADYGLSKKSCCRVTRWVCEKLEQNVAHFMSQLIRYLYGGKRRVKNLGNFCRFEINRPK
jgi:hypothetical protein